MMQTDGSGSSDGQTNGGRGKAGRRRRWLTGAVLVAILAVGAGARFWRLGGKALWLDETASLHYVNRPFGEALAAVRDHDGHPPLYYALLHAWLWGSQDAGLARALSAAVSVATLAAFFGLARALLPRGAALASTLVLAASAFQVYFAQEARHYALATFFVTLSWLFLVRLLGSERTGRWPLWLGLALSNALALYTFYYTAFAIGAQAVALAALWRRGGKRLAPRWALWQLVPAALLAPYVAMVLPRLRVVARHLPSGARSGVGLGGLRRVAWEFVAGPLVEGLGDDGAGLGRAALAIVAVAALAGLYGLWDRRLRPAVAVALAWLLAPLVFVALFPLKGHAFEPKHVAFAAPALALLPGIAIGTGRRLAGLLVGAAAGLGLLALSAVGAGWYLQPRIEKEGWRACVRAMAERARDHDVVVFNPPHVSLPFHYYYHPDRCGWICPPVDETPAPLPGTPFALSGRAVGRRVWLVEVASPVAIPNPEVSERLDRFAVAHFQVRYDLVGTLRLTLFDTSRPAGSAGPPARQDAPGS